jgi:curved DNA-binding protein CbpA
VHSDEDDEEESDASWLAQSLQREQNAPPTPQATTSKFSEKQGKEAYLQLARELHPDKVQDPQKQAERTAQMQELTEAWQARNLTRILELLHTWGSARAQQGVWQGQDLSKLEQSLQEDVRKLQIRFRNLRDPGDGADWWALSEDPKAFSQHIEQVRRGHRQELLFLAQCKSAWLTPQGLANWMAQTPR